MCAEFLNVFTLYNFLCCHPLLAILSLLCPTNSSQVVVDHWIEQSVVLGEYHTTVQTNTIVDETVICFGWVVLRSPYPS